MKSALLIYFLSLATIASSQIRIETNLSTRFQDLNLTGNVHFVVGHNWLLSGGMSGGFSPKMWIDNDRAQLDQGLRVQSPYPSLNQGITSENASYTILDYSSSARFVRTHVCVGYFHEFGTQHGIRANTYFLLQYVSNQINGYYYSSSTQQEIYRSTVFNHFVGGASLELFHTIRLNARNTLCYGVKIPYFFSIDKARFNPMNPKDNFYGFEPELSIGLTRMIGSCPEKGPK
ncbi:MAG: hypothetical protein A3D92_13730 [Bacteroidetes bacterium RIFCSPHIGHO2_02_FULL_44_7]|nr:MAG: hypothetical protein A3D92_13730 [Bacteroidetes bacterium RIFCSPHIGHO2_02_FULL_44_7]